MYVDSHKHKHKHKHKEKQKAKTRLDRKGEAEGKTGREKRRAKTKDVCRQKTGVCLVAANSIKNSEQS